MTKVGLAPRGSTYETHRFTELLQMGTVPAVVSSPYLYAPFVDMPAIIVMPDDAPEIKKAGVRAYGGDIVGYDRENGDREAIARELCDQNGAVLVPSYDDFFVMAGQGTVGLEIAAQCQQPVQPEAFFTRLSILMRPGL